MKINCLKTQMKMIYLLTLKHSLVLRMSLNLKTILKVLSHLRRQTNKNKNNQNKLKFLITSQSYKNNTTMKLLIAL